MSDEEKLDESTRALVTVLGEIVNANKDKSDSKLVSSHLEMLVRLDERTGALVKGMEHNAYTNQENFKSLEKSMMGALEKHTADDDRRFLEGGTGAKKLSDRVKVLEDWRILILGGMALGGFLIAFLMWAVTTFYRSGQGTIVERKTETETIQRPVETKEKK